MRSLKSGYKGSITIEYMIVMLFLMIPIWYAVIGGSGSWLNVDASASNKGNLTKSSTVPSEGYPGLVKTLNDKEIDFADQINQP